MDLVSCSVYPMYAQVAIFDPDREDSYPEWGDDDAEAAATTHGVAVATISDRQGQVQIRVVYGEASRKDARLIYAGSIRSSLGRLQVGSVIGADLHQVLVSPGGHSVRIETESAVDHVDEITISLDGA